MLKSSNKIFSLKGHKPGILSLRETNLMIEIVSIMKNNRNINLWPLFISSHLPLARDLTMYAAHLLISFASLIETY
jgi:hypothetical protein